jgi:hypothetical protein
MLEKKKLFFMLRKLRERENESKMYCVCGKYKGMHNDNNNNLRGKCVPVTSECFICESKCEREREENEIHRKDNCERE